MKVRLKEDINQGFSSNFNTTTSGEVIVYFFEPLSEEDKRKGWV